MKVLVTGGAGFIGSHVVDQLVERGDDVVVIDNLDPQVHGQDTTEPVSISHHVKSQALQFFRADILNREMLSQALVGAEVVVHLAAAVGVGQSMYEPYYYVNNNATGTGLLLDLIVKSAKNVSKIVVASSMSLYGEGAYLCSSCGGTQARPRDEHQLRRGEWENLCARCGDALTPRPTPESKPAEIASVYAATKKHQEDLVVSFGKAYNIPSFALRFFNVYGPRQSLSNPYTGVAAIFMSRLMNHKPPLVFEDGEQSRDFIFVDDVANAVQRAIDYPGTGTHVLNIGTGRPVTVRDVATVLAEKLRVGEEPHLLNRYRSGDIRHCFSDPTMAETILGFRATTSIEDGMDRLIDWSRNTQARDDSERCLAELKTYSLVR
jgi:dTDP-L-rhamnose 4-epimerase